MYRMNGVVPPMITPFLENGVLDEKGLRTLVDFLRQEVHGLFICGSYGSGALMTPEERKRVVELTMEENKGKADVVVHVGTTHNAATVDLAKHAVAQGVQAVAAVGPYYFHHNRDSILSFFDDLVSAAGDVPVYVYNNPKFQGYEIDFQIIKELRDIGVHGIKDATFDIIEHAKYQRELGDTFDVVLGTEAMFLAAAALGTHAFIPGLGNAYPEINVQMFQEAEKKNFEACKRTQFKVNRMRDIMYLARSTQQAVYTMLAIRGILDSYPRKPFLPASAREKHDMQAALDQLLHE